jgi:hypothetical protein
MQQNKHSATIDPTYMLFSTINPITDAATRNETERGNGKREKGTMVP